MADEQPQSRSQRIVAALSDADALRRRGVPDLWIRQCAEIVAEFRDLQRRIQELEARNPRSDGQSAHDTMVF